MMAYLEAGLTNAELAERFHSEAQSLTEQEIVARFGRPRHPSRGDLAPYAFLEENQFSANAIRSYHELHAPDWTDDRHRMYFRYDDKLPRTVYVALPISETLRERQARVSVLKRQDFPRPGEEIVLYKASARTTAKRQHDDDDDTPRQELLRARVARVEFQRTATAVLTLDSDLPEERASHPALDSDQLKKRIQHNVSRLQHEAQAHGAPSNAELVVFSRAPRHVAPATKRHRASVTAPRAPKAPK